MRAVLMKAAGDPDVLYLGEYPDPQSGADELLVRVHATAVNRADILQRRGKYAPPPGASPIIGLEMAGEVIEVGPNCSDQFRPGDRIFGLLPGGGYAELVALPESMAMPIPDNLSYEQAAAIPEAFLTAYLNLFWLGGLEDGETALIHAGASGVGTAAIQLARERGAKVIATAGSAKKVALCRELGAEAAFSHRDGPWAARVLAATGERGVDVILDPVGASYWDQNLQVLAVDGRLVVIATLGGSKVSEVDLAHILRRRLRIIGSTLRARSSRFKVRLTADFAQFALPRLGDGRLRAVIDRVYDWNDAAAAHAYMEANQNRGKVVLRVR